MLKKKILLSFLLLLFFSSLMACQTSSTTTTTIGTTLSTSETTPYDTHLEMERLPFKTVYQTQEELNLLGLIVLVVQSNGVKIPLNNDALITSGYDKNQVGMQTVILTYNTFHISFSVYVKEPNVAINIVLEITPPTQVTYTRGDEFLPDGLIVKLIGLDESFTILTPDQYSISSPNMSLLGEQVVSISVLGLRGTFFIQIEPKEDVVPITMEYYLSIQGLEGTELLLELRRIVNTGITRKTYDDARQILQITDRDPQNPSNIILVYRRTSVIATWDAGVTWNREHVWPQSYLGVSTNGSSRHVGSDLHNLKPANPSENSSRNNRYFDTIDRPRISYVPHPEVRGDLARILFYMVVMYDYLRLIDTEPKETLPAYSMAMLSALLLWHIEDPVDDFERNRNNVIYSYQNNRNPFIDYPHLVSLIWPA